MQEQYRQLVPPHRRTPPATSTAVAGRAKGGVSVQRVRPNPSVKRTRNGVAPLAFISFWAKGSTPLRSAYLER